MAKQKTIEENIKDFNKTHKDKYDYSEYTDVTKKSFDKITIICLEHGKFQQNIHNHKNGQGCPQCRLKKLGNAHKFTINQNLNDFKKVHGDKYLYNKYVDENKYSKEKIIITCKIHGDFKQTINNHKRGNGCPKCGKIEFGLKTRISIENNKLNFIKVHNNKYDYSNYTEFFTCEEKIKIICPKHGAFEQTISKHLQGQGCNLCAREENKKQKQNNPTGWSYTNWEKASLKSKNFDSFKVYIIECWDDNEKFYKIGKTFSKIEKRFCTKKELPYEYKVIKTYKGTAEYVSKLENILKKLNKENKYIPNKKFRGMYECFHKLNNN